MNKFKIGNLVAMVVLLAMANVALAVIPPIGTIPAAEQAKDVATAPAVSPVITDDWELIPYYILSDNPVLKKAFGVNHEFPGAFSTELTKDQVALLSRMGVKTEPVQIYQIIGKPVCGDGTCQGHEPRTCPEDCPPEPTPTPTPEPERACYPTKQYPWGIVGVNGGSGGTGVMVAVLDTGVDQDHPDLQTNIKLCETKVTHFKPDTKSCEDKHGHGSHVSGTVLANGGSDGLGIFGVAPQASLMAVKVCDRRGWCYGDDIAAGIYYAANKKAQIINMSLGKDKFDLGIKKAIDDNPEVLYVAAAGNNYQQADSMVYPAAYYKVMGISAIQEDETLASFTSIGLSYGDPLVVDERELDLTAPGAEVESTWNDGCYHVGNGTSMATPHVAGLAAKLWDIADGTLDGLGNAADARNYLDFAIVKDLYSPGHDEYTGFGLPIAP